MAVYAIGDVQGCYQSLMALLDKIYFDSARDQLWFTGDLVNRGPHSVEVLRFVSSLGASAVTVLGNHDLHLLAVAAGHAELEPRDTISAVLAAPDGTALLSWLRNRPLLHHDSELGYALIHAGVVPQWDLTGARACAAEVESVLRDAAHAQFYRHMYGDSPDLWQDKLVGWNRLRFVVNALTRLRYCDDSGRMRLDEKRAPNVAARGLTPWFQMPGRRTRNDRIVFGHWSSLGFWDDDGVISLDAGCVWGGALLAMRLTGRKRTLFRVPCPRPAQSL